MILNHFLQRTCWQQEEGYVMVEYLLLLSMLVTLVFASFTLYTNPISQLYGSIDTLFSTLDSGITF